MENSSVSNNCNTCKFSFSNVDIVREHYRSEWHCFNAKRRSSMLAPVSESDYYKYSTSRKKEKVVKIISKNTIEVQNVSSPNETSSDLGKLTITNVAHDILMSKKALTTREQELTTKDEDELNSISAVETSQPVGPTISIFDDKIFEPIEECLLYMEVSFGFFVPDREYVSDLNGLLMYLGEKVKEGGICLYCQKQFGSGKACQNHMIQKSHCKIAYEDDIDIDEFEDFYDFSSSYSDDETDRVLEVSPIGELVLLDGRLVGHRDLRKYYKQRYRQDDTRPAVLAQRREDLLRMGISVTNNGTDLTSSELQTLSDAQVISLVMKKRREMRKSLMIEQRAQQRQAFRSQRREYQSTVDKLRSSATTTEKIRDYHGMLK